MPKYNYDPSKVSSTIEIFPAGEQEFIVGDPKAFIRKNAKDEDSFGVRFKLTIAEGDFRGKTTVFTCYMHSEGAQSMSKRFHMAAYGFGANEQDTIKVAEEKFNAAVGGDDWSFDPDTGTVGEAWRRMAGTRVIGNLGIGKNTRTDEPQQEFKSWRPAIAVAA